MNYVIKFLGINTEFEVLCVRSLNCMSVLDLDMNVPFSERRGIRVTHSLLDAETP